MEPPSILRPVDNVKAGYPRKWDEPYNAYSPVGRFHGFAATSTGEGQRRTCVIDEAKLLQKKTTAERLRTLFTVANICLLDWEKRMTSYEEDRRWDLGEKDTLSTGFAVRRAREVARLLRRELQDALAAPRGTFNSGDLIQLQQTLKALETQNRTWAHVARAPGGPDVGDDDRDVVPFSGFA